MPDDTDFFEFSFAKMLPVLFPAQSHPWLNQILLKCVYPVPQISFRLLREANAKPEIPVIDGTLAYDIYYN